MRLRALCSDGVVDEVAKLLKKAREKGLADWAEQIHARYTYRMHYLSEFMRTLMQHDSLVQSGQSTVGSSVGRTLQERD